MQHTASVCVTCCISVCYIFQSFDVMFATLESWHQMNQGQFWQAFAVTTAKACSKLCLVRLVPAFHLMTPLGNWLYHSSKTVSVQPCCLFDLFVCYDVMFATLESWHQMNQAQFWQAFAVTTAKACSKLCLVRLVPAFHLMTPLGNWLYHSSKTVSVQPCCLFDLFSCLFTRLHPSDHCDCW